MHAREKPPQVTVICTSYNQNRFVERAIESVWGQTYQSIQLIVIDNGSTDGTKETIERILKKHPEVAFLPLAQNVGLCKAFNVGLAQATGKYVIDLAADDVMPPRKIQAQVAAFEQLSASYAVVFTNAQYIDEHDQHAGYHYKTDPQNRAVGAVPQGFVFEQILKHYFICTPTMMIRRDVLTQIGGYDESLGYEDFDFWVRTTPHYKYHYLDDVLMQKRIVSGSLSGQFYRPENDLLRSSLVVCGKAYNLTNTPHQRNLLAGRIGEFIKKCAVVGNHQQAVAFAALLGEMQEIGWKTKLLVWASGLKLPINRFYLFYDQLRNRKRRKLHQKGLPHVQLHE